MSDYEKLTSKQPWECFTCGSGYAEYVNGCPHCWEAGIRSKVVHVQALESQQAGRDKA